MALSSDSIFVGFKTGSFIFIDYIILLIFVGKSKWLTKKKVNLILNGKPMMKMMPEYKISKFQRIIE